MQFCLLYKVSGSTNPFIVPISDFATDREFAVINRTFTGMGELRAKCLHSADEASSVR